MSDAQTLELIEALERRVANLEILEDPVRVTRLINDITSSATFDFTKQVFTLWPGSAITLTLTESGYLWWGYQFLTRNRSAARLDSIEIQAFLDGGAQGLFLVQGHPNVDERHTTAVLGRSDNLLAAGAHMIDVRINVRAINDIVRGSNLTGYAFWTRA